MKHFAMTLDLKDDPELVERYREHHRNPWPEPLQGLWGVGVEGMQIFLLGHRMFMYMTTVDDFEPARDFARYVEQNPKAAEWDELMRTFQQPVPEAGAGEWWASMECVFDLADHI